MSFTLYQHPQINRTRICTSCLSEYELGLTGTVNGCDRCDGIIRLPNGMIDYSASSPEIFIVKGGEVEPCQA